MTWLRRHRFQSYLDESMWLVPVTAIPAALLALPLTRWIDDATGWQLMAYTLAGAHSLLDSIAPAALTLIPLILSSLLLAVQLAASQFSPRLMAGLLAQTPIRACLFTFL